MYDITSSGISKGNKLFHALRLKTVNKKFDLVNDENGTKSIAIIVHMLLNEQVVSCEKVFTDETKYIIHENLLCKVYFTMSFRKKKRVFEICLWK